MNHADRIIEALQAAGAARLFGVPGGGGNADVIEAARLAGLPFTLAHTETASVFMATAQAEITGAPGACLATLGPGAASLMNGVANAFLDRVRLMLLTDCATDPAMQHQNLPHQEMFRPLVKWTGRPTGQDAGAMLECAIDALCANPPGAVHLDISTGVASAEANDPPVRAREHRQEIGPLPDAVKKILERARRPSLLLGLGARTSAIAAAVRSLSEQFGIPALVTYKAKGVVPDRDPWFGGVLTNGTLEREVLEQADVFLAIGLDPVELLPRPWKFPQPVISITVWPMHQKQIPLTAELVGDPVAWINAVAPFLGPTHWDREDLARNVAAQLARMRPEGEGFLPHRVVELAAEVYPGARITVDAGAFMFPVVALWPATNPCDVLISNGLSTMGFALPAAIGAALLDRSKPVIAFTGDGGLLMCVAELRTAAREHLPVRVIVFDDGDLTLIRMKQDLRGFQPEGVSIGEIDWPAVSAGFGVPGFIATDEASLMDRLRETATHPGPVLIAVKISTGTYQATMRALRG